MHCAVGGCLLLLLCADAGQATAGVAADGLNTAAPPWLQGSCVAEGGALSLLQAESAKALRRRDQPALNHSAALAGERDAADLQVKPLALLTKAQATVVQVVGEVAASHRVRATINMFIILPLLGLIATLLAIWATVVVEQRAVAVSQRLEARGRLPAAASVHGDVTWSSGNIHKGLQNLVSGELRLPRARVPGAGAEGLLRAGGPGGRHQTPPGSMSPSFADKLGFLEPDGEVITVQRPLEDGRLGIKLRDDTLEITDFFDERAREHGFRVGDKITQVNFVRVAHQDDFLQEVTRAVELNRTQGLPMAFSVARAGPGVPNEIGLGDARPPSGTKALGEAGRQLSATSTVQGTDVRVNTLEETTVVPRSTTFTAPAPSGMLGAEMLGSWTYSDEISKYTYQVSREATGLLLRFSQRLPTGQLATGSLAPSGDGWFSGPLSLESGMRHGSIRLRYDSASNEMISNLMMKDSSQYGEEVRAVREEIPPSVAAAEDLGRPVGGMPGPGGQ